MLWMATASSPRYSMLALPAAPQRFVGARFCASVAGGTGGGAWQQLLLDEVDQLTDEAIPIGTLFRMLSQDSRKALGDAKLPLETFLLRHPAKYSVFKSRGNPSIMVSKFGAAPETAAHAKEKAIDEIFDGRERSTAQGGANARRVYSVLKYISNEWSSYTELVIPDEVKKQCIGKPPKKFFESNPRYFDVRFNPHRAHTFEVRRSLALQQYTATQQQQPQSGGSPLA